MDLQDHIEMAVGLVANLEVEAEVSAMEQELESEFVKKVENMEKEIRMIE